jgi:hypothetical protein
MSWTVWWSLLVSLHEILFVDLNDFVRVVDRRTGSERIDQRRRFNVSVGGGSFVGATYTRNSRFRRWNVGCKVMFYEKDWKKLVKWKLNVIYEWMVSSLIINLIIQSVSWLFMFHILIVTWELNVILQSLALNFNWLLKSEDGKLLN